MDAGSTHTLGAAITAVIMLSSVAYVVTFENLDPRPDQAIENAYTERARDTLAILHDWPLPEGSCEGRTLEDRIVHESFTTGVSPTFSNKQKDLFGDVSQADLWLKTRDGRIPLATQLPKDEYGYGASRTYDPDWEGRLNVTSLSAGTGAERLASQTLAQYDSKLVHMREDALRTRIWLDDGKAIAS